MIRHPDQRVGVFIDTQNMYYSARHLHSRKVDFNAVVERAVGDRRLFRQIAYVVTTKSGDERPFLEALERIGIELREKELKEYYSGQKKADWDVGLTVDVIRMLDMLDVVVIVSGDGDYVPLVSYCKSRGRAVEVMGFRETTATVLVEEADAYINMSDHKDTYLIGGRKGGSKKKRKQRNVNSKKKNHRKKKNKNKNKNKKKKKNRNKKKGKRKKNKHSNKSKGGNGHKNSNKSKGGNKKKESSKPSNDSYFHEPKSDDPAESRKKRLTF
jgi:uncharacterized LabA/DUF88 family protein